MNYRHIYHAGVFADVVKHITLIAILEQLALKDKPFAVLDAFAGCGFYNLNSVESLKTNESVEGIKKLLSYANVNTLELPLLQKYLQVVKAVGSGNIYPGSPLIIHKSMREFDRLIATELHPEDFSILKRFFYAQNKKPQTGTHHLDAYKAIKAFVPFFEKRGLIFIDPPFEVKDEFTKILSSLDIIYKRAANIITMIWYPIKNELEVKSFHQTLKNTGFKEILKIEFALKKASKNLEKCGILILNPPNIRVSLEQVFRFLTDNIYQGRAFFNMETLNYV